MCIHWMIASVAYDMTSMTHDWSVGGPVNWPFAQYLDAKRGGMKEDDTFLWGGPVAWRHTISERSFLNMQKRGIGPKSAFHHLEQDFMARIIHIHIIFPTAYYTKTHYKSTISQFHSGKSPIQSCEMHPLNAGRSDEAREGLTVTRFVPFQYNRGSG